MSKSGSAAPATVTLKYHAIRTTTSPDEVKTGVKSFVANLPAFEILKLDTRDNLRGYLAEYDPKKRNRVHDAIAMTIDKTPERFITRNSGFVVAAADIEVDDNKKVMKLVEPSILNGAQSQGEIRRWIAETYGDEVPEPSEDPPFYVRAEIIVDDDPAQVVETAIARNTATPVKSITQAGARGHLLDLQESISKRRPNLKIRMAETDINVYDTRKILQYARLLMPASVSGHESAAETLRAYKNPEQCLTDFCEWYERRDDTKKPELRRRYEFTVQIAPLAIDEFEYWERHEGWTGHRVWAETIKGGRACRRDKNGKILSVSPGLVFPILGALSELVEEASPGGWVINKPSVFDPAEMIAHAVKQFRGHDSDPMQMGRSAAAYDALRTYPRALVKVIRDIQAKSR